MDKRTACRFLGVREGAKSEDIRRAYNEKVKKIKQFYDDDPEYVSKKLAEANQAFNAAVGKPYAFDKIETKGHGISKGKSNTLISRGDRDSVDIFDIKGDRRVDRDFRRKKSSKVVPSKIGIHSPIDFDNIAEGAKAKYKQIKRDTKTAKNFFSVLLSGLIFFIMFASLVRSCSIHSTYDNNVVNMTQETSEYFDEDEDFGADTDENVSEAFEDEDSEDW